MKRSLSLSVLRRLQRGCQGGQAICACLMLEPREEAALHHMHTRMIHVGDRLRRRRNHLQGNDKEITISQYNNSRFEKNILLKNYKHRRGAVLVNLAEHTMLPALLIAIIDVTALLTGLPPAAFRSTQDVVFHLIVYRH